MNLEKEPSNFFIGEVPLLSGYELNLEKHDCRSNPQVLKQDDEVYLVFNEVFPRFVKLYPSTEPGFIKY